MSGAVVCHAALALGGLFGCVPLCRTRARLGRPSRLPVGDVAPVGELGLFGERAFGLAHGVVGRPDRRRALGLGGAGGEREAPELLLGQRRLGVGVVLAAGEHAPEQAGELAGAGDDRDLVAAAGADALIEGAQRTGLTHGAPGGFDEGVASVGGALLGDAAVLGGLIAGLSDPWVEAEVADE